MTLKDYLTVQVSASTVKIYLFEINHFIKFIGKSQAKQASYETIIKYVIHLRNQYDNPGTIHRIIQAIKQYFFYLIEIGERSSHPCRYLSIQDKSRNEIQIQDLLNENELERLLVREDRYENLRLRNQVVMSLLVYQGLRIKELVNLKVEDVDLVNEKLNVKARRGTNQRLMNLKPTQLLILQDYLNEARKSLLKTESSNLIITARGTAEKGDGVHYLVSTYQDLYPTKRITPTKIRQSVIVNLLKKGNDLRVVQVFAGHKKASTTEKYRQTNLEQLRLFVNRYHPLG